MEDKSEGDSEKKSQSNTHQTLNLSKYEDKIQLTFDYEINDLKLEDTEDGIGKIYYYDDFRKEYVPVDYDLFFDRLKPLPKLPQSKEPLKSLYETNEYDKDFEEAEEIEQEEELEKANLLKRLVSKKKRRFQDSQFDLDMSYITDKVIAMGYPSTGMETLYRNDLQDIIKFFKVKHNDDFKVYNLCLEKDRIYKKESFPNGRVGLFPANDHNPSPIKLILEFCIDICLYLIKHPDGVAAVHCKAGKGRTGVMICAYLVFSGLCINCEQAFRHYARIRTKNNKGVTIASQRRYIKYFENFLKANFYPPYIKLIPKIIRTQFSFLIQGNYVRIKNILQSFQKEESYFISTNKFKLKGIKIGPLPSGKELKLKVCDFIESKFDLPKKIMDSYKDIKGVYYEQYFTPELIAHSDIKIMIKKDMNFYTWVNFWYSTLEMVKIFVNRYKIHIKKEIKSIKDIKVKDLIGTRKDENKVKKKVANIDINVQSKEDEETSLNDIISLLNYNTDLNELINTINSYSENFEFDKENLSIRINSFNFDKFKEKSDFDNFEMTILYGLCDN